MVDELLRAIEAVRLAEEAGNERMWRLALDVLAAKLKTVRLYLQGRPEELGLAELAAEAELLLDAERPGRRPMPAPPALTPEGTGAFPDPSSLLAELLHRGPLRSGDLAGRRRLLRQLLDPGQVTVVSGLAPDAVLKASAKRLPDVSGAGQAQIGSRTLGVEARPRLVVVRARPQSELWRAGVRRATIALLEDISERQERHDLIQPYGVGVAWPDPSSPLYAFLRVFFQASGGSGRSLRHEGAVLAVARVERADGSLELAPAFFPATRIEETAKDSMSTSLFVIPGVKYLGLFDLLGRIRFDARRHDGGTRLQLSELGVGVEMNANTHEQWGAPRNVTPHGGPLEQLLAILANALADHQLGLGVDQGAASDKGVKPLEIDLLWARRPELPTPAVLGRLASWMAARPRGSGRPPASPPARDPELSPAVTLLDSWKDFAADLVDGSLPGLTASDVRDAMGWLGGLADAIRGHAPDARIPELDTVPLWLDRLRHMHDWLDAEERAAAAIARLDRLARPRPGAAHELREALGELVTARDAANDAVVAVRAAGGPAARQAAGAALDELGRAIDRLDRQAAELREIEEQLVAQGVRVERLPVRDRPPERWKEEAAIADTLRRPLERAARQARQDASWMADLAGPLPPAEEGAEAEVEPSGEERLERESARVDAARERALSRLRELRAPLDGLPVTPDVASLEKRLIGLDIELWEAEDAIEMVREELDGAPPGANTEREAWERRLANALVEADVHVWNAEAELPGLDDEVTAITTRAHARTWAPPRPTLVVTDAAYFGQVAELLTLRDTLDGAGRGLPLPEGAGATWAEEPAGGAVTAFHEAVVAATTLLDGPVAGAGPLRSAHAELLRRLQAVEPSAARRPSLVGDLQRSIDVLRALRAREADVLARELGDVASGAARMPWPEARSRATRLRVLAQAGDHDACAAADLVGAVEQALAAGAPGLA
jgi:hypothetical protein